MCEKESASRQFDRRNAISVFRHAGQIFVKRRIRDARAFRIANLRRTVRTKRGHSEGHRYAVITVRFDFRAAQLAGPAACDFQPVGTFFDLRAHAPQIFRQSGDAVALFYAQFCGVANFDPRLGERTERRQHRQFVNDQRYLRAFDDSALQLCALHRDVTDDFSSHAAQ